MENFTIQTCFTDPIRGFINNGRPLPRHLSIHRKRQIQQLKLPAPSALVANEITSMGAGANLSGVASKDWRQRRWSQDESTTAAATLIPTTPLPPTTTSFDDCTYVAI